MSSFKYIQVLVQKAAGTLTAGAALQGSAHPNTQAIFYLPFKVARK